MGWKTQDMDVWAVSPKRDVSRKRPAGASRQSLMGPHVNLDASDSVNGVMNRRTAKSGLGEIESVCNMGFQPANYLG